MKDIVAHKVQSSLVNDDERAIRYKAMFESNDEGLPPQRTEHPNISQAAARLK